LRAATNTGIATWPTPRFPSFRARLAGQFPRYGLLIGTYLVSIASTNTQRHPPYFLNILLFRYRTMTICKPTGSNNPYFSATIN
jgi:hypothetical protein